MEVRALLKEITRPVYTIASDQSVEDAVRLMNGLNASAVVVTENSRPVGIFAERDVFRFFQRGPKSKISELELHHTLANRLIVARPEDEVGHVINKMMKADIDHLAVIENEQIIGMLALNDLTAHQLGSLREEVRQLKDYIDALHDAGRD